MTFALGSFLHGLDFQARWVGKSLRHPKNLGPRQPGVAQLCRVLLVFRNI
jgi:hypothetical protein